jgi:hypothetical protein
MFLKVNARERERDAFQCVARRRKAATTTTTEMETFDKAMALHLKM